MPSTNTNEEKLLSEAKLALRGEADALQNLIQGGGLFSFKEAGFCGAIQNPHLPAAAPKKVLTGTESRVFLYTKVQGLPLPKEV